jgi:predicted ester cyclase
MSEETKQLVRRYIEASNDEGPSANRRFLAPGWIGWDSRNGSKSTVEDAIKEHEVVLTGFPDARLTVEDQLAEGDKVATRLTMTGTHTKEYLGVAPTGKRISISLIEIDRIADGKIVESWSESSGLGFYFQLTGKPAPSLKEVAHSL